MEPAQLDERVDRIGKWFSGGQAGPLELRLRLTRRCNLSCIFCRCGSIPARDKPEEELSLEMWLKVLDHVMKLGCQHVDITGGEPFLRREDALRIMERIKMLGMSGAVTTNATLLREVDVRRIVDMRWDTVQVSLDGAVASTHDMLRQSSGCHGRVLETLGWFKKAKEKRGSSKPALTVATVLTNLNYGEIPSLVEIAHCYDCESFRLTPMVEQFKKAGQYQISKKHTSELMRALQDALRIAETLGLETNVGEIKRNFSLALAKDKFSQARGECVRSGDGPEEQFPACFEPWSLLRIDSLGWLNCCTSDTECRLNLRDIPLEEVWHNDYFESIRSKMLAGTPLPSCGICCYAVYSDNFLIAARVRERFPHFAGSIQAPVPPGRSNLRGGGVE